MALAAVDGRGGAVTVQVPVGPSMAAQNTSSAGPIVEKANKSSTGPIVINRALGL